MTCHNSWNLESLEKNLFSNSKKWVAEVLWKHLLSKILGLAAGCSVGSNQVRSSAFNFWSVRISGFGRECKVRNGSKFGFPDFCLALACFFGRTILEVRTFRSIFEF